MSELYMHKLEVIPCLLAPRTESDMDSNTTESGINSRTVWSLPYSVVLRHATEEVLDAFIEAIEPVRATLTSLLRSQVMDELTEGLKKHDWFRGFDISDDIPKIYSLNQWIKQAKVLGATIFIADTTVNKFAPWWHEGFVTMLYIIHQLALALKVMGIKVSLFCCPFFFCHENHWVLFEWLACYSHNMYENL